MARIVPVAGRKPRRRRLPKGPSREELEGRIKGVARNSDAIVFSPHAIDQMRDRGVLMREVLECLREGSGEGDPVLDEFGEWRLFMVRRVAGRRIKTRVAAGGTFVTVVTVYPPT